MHNTQEKCISLNNWLSEKNGNSCIIIFSFIYINKWHNFVANLISWRLAKFMTEDKLFFVLKLLFCQIVKMYDLFAEKLIGLDQYCEEITICFDGRLGHFLIVWCKNVRFWCIMSVLYWFMDSELIKLLKSSFITRLYKIPWNF